MSGARVRSNAGRRASFAGLQVLGQGAGIAVLSAVADDAIGGGLYHMVEGLAGGDYPVHRQTRRRALGGNWILGVACCRRALICRWAMGFVEVWHVGAHSLFTLNSRLDGAARRDWQPWRYLSHVFLVLNVGKFFSTCSILPKIPTEASWRCRNSPMHHAFMTRRCTSRYQTYISFNLYGLALVVSYVRCGVSAGRPAC